MPESLLRTENIPSDSLIFGYGPMVPFVLGALGCWMSPAVRDTAISLTIIWGSLIITFVGGVRRGFGFGDSRASLTSEIWTMMVYVSIGGIALILQHWDHVTSALAMLVVGFVLVPVLDQRAALAGNAPAHFARFRPMQMPIAAIALAAALARMLML